MTSRIENQDSRLIFLVGFMGSGKTTVGRLLAARLGYSFVDLDQIIEERAGLTVREIFRTRGETSFRELESGALAACRGLAQAVIALGGGAFVSEANRNSCRSMGKTIWLRCPLDICLARVACDGSRPLLGGRAAMEALLSERAPRYSEAEFVVDSGADSSNEVVDAILAALDKGRLVRA